MKASLLITKCKVLVFTSGSTIDRMRVNGKITKFKVKVNAFGQTEDSMKVNLSMS